MIAILMIMMTNLMKPMIIMNIKKNGDSEESNKNEESEIIQGRSKH